MRSSQIDQLYIPSEEERIRIYKKLSTCNQNKEEPTAYIN